METKRPNRIDELVGRLREDIRAAEREGREPPRSFDGLPGLPSLRDAQELRDLNREWRLEPAAPIRSHRKLLGPPIVAMKRRLQRLVVAVLEGYFTRERNFFATLVRYLNRLTDHVEQLVREAHQTEELTRKRAEERLDEVLEAQRSMERTVEDLRAQVERLRAERDRSEDGER